MLAVVALFWALIPHALHAAGWQNVPIGGGGYVTGLAASSTGGVIYCRSDVGGAFRWVPAGDTNGNGSWMSISDAMVSYGTASASSLMGVESIGVDPRNANRVFVGAGNKVYVSEDQGASWSAISPTIAMDPNGSYRDHGERLAVDPNNSNLVWYGSGQSGLQKGVKQTDGTWAWSQIPAAAVPFGLTKAGVTCVICDPNPGGAATIVYACVKDATTGGVYRSMDGGTTWGKVPGAPGLTPPQRAQIASNGTLYVTAGTNGAARLLRGVAESLVLLSSLPGGVNYRGVAVDPHDASGNTVYVAEGNWASNRNKILRSVDGGASWATQSTTFNDGPVALGNQARTEPDGTPCLTGYWFGNISSLLVNPDPARSNELWAADFFGVARTRNAEKLGTNPGSWWYTLQKGQEETVVLSLENAPSGARLFTGLADVSGFKHNDITLRPSGTAGNGLGGGNNTSLDFCENNPNVWARVRVDQGSTGSPGSGSISSDGGATWLNVGQVAVQTVTNSPVANWETWDVGTYLAQLKAKGVNIVTLVVATAMPADYSANVLSFNSREASDPTARPRLVVTSATGTTNLVPGADARVEGANPTVNYGNATTLSTSYAWGTAAYSRWSYLKFDLSSVGAIASASLQLYRLSTTGNATIFSVGVYACLNTTWVEGDGGSDNLPTGELTWNNKPAAVSNGGDPAGGSDYWLNGTRISGRRVAVSATNANVMVWMPINTATPYYSNDRGVTWTASVWANPADGFTSQIAGVYTLGSQVGLSGQPLAADRGNGCFYLAKFGGSGHVIFRSTDNGATWTKLATVSNGNSYNMFTPQLVAAPVSPGHPSGGDVWLCDDGVYSGNGGGLWRSTNSVQNWAQVGAGSVGKITAVSFGKSASGSGYAVYVAGVVAGTNGIFRSDDYGGSWAKLAAPTINGVTALAGDRQMVNSVYLGTGGRGVFHYVAGANPDGDPYGGIAASLPGVVQAEDFNLGGEGVAYHDADTTNSGGLYRPTEGVDIQATTDTGGGYNVGWTSAGEWLKYTINVASSGTYNITLRIAAAAAGGAARIQFNGLDQATFTIPNTGGGQTWQDVTASNTTLTIGQQIMCLAVDAGGFNVNYIKIAPADITPVGPPGYTWIALDKQSCTFTQMVDLAYGANGSFNDLTNRTGTITFDIATFGDPLPGTAKYGFYKLASTSSSSNVVTWTGGLGGTGTSWNVAANWDSGRVPGAGDEVLFTDTGITAGKVIALDASQTVNQVTIATTLGFTIGSTNDATVTNTLALADVERRDVSGTEAAHVIRAPLILVTNSTWTVAGSASLIVSNKISGGSFTLTKNGTGELDMAVANSYGTTYVLAGTLKPVVNVTIVPGDLVVGGGSNAAVFSGASANASIASSGSMYAQTNGTIYLGNAQYERYWYTYTGGTIVDNYSYVNGGNIYMAGGTINGSGNTYGTLYGITTYATNTTALISVSPGVWGYGSVTINVADGTAPIDLKLAAGVAAGASGYTLTKSGAGVLQLAAGSSYADNTTAISAGTFLADNPSGSATATSTVTIASGAMLGGTGTIVGAGVKISLTAGSSTNSMATLWPGTINATNGQHVIGTLTVGSAAQSNTVTFGKFTRLAIQLGATTGSCDRLVVNGYLNLGGLANTNYLDLNASGVMPHAGTYTVATFGGLTGRFTTVRSAPGAQLPPYYAVRYLGTSSGNGNELLNGSITVTIPSRTTMLFAR